MGSQQTAIVNKLLTDVSNKIEPQGYVSEQIFPMVKVVQSTGKLGSYGTGHMRILTTLTGGKNKYPTVDTRQQSTQTYSIDKHGLSDMVTEEEYANVEKPFDAEADTTDELTTLLWLAKEKGIADSLTDTAVLTNNVTLSGTDQYTDYTNSDPLGDFKTARASVYNKVGMAPDTVILPWAVYDTLRYHPKILEVGYKYNRSGKLTLDDLAAVFDVKRVLIAEAIYESANQGQTSAILPVWGKHIVFAVSPTTAAKRQVSLGYRFQQFSDTRRVYKNAVTNPANAKEILVDDHYDYLIANADAGYLIKDSIA
jgi:hypothetical protein